MDLKNRLLSLSIQELNEMLEENTDSFVRTVAIREAIRVKKRMQRTKKQPEVRKKRRAKKRVQEEDLEELRAEDFLDSILFDEEPEIPATEESYNPLLAQEVRKDSINNRVMSRMNSELVIKNSKGKKKRFIAPYVDEGRTPPEFDEDLDPTDFSNDRLM